MKNKLNIFEGITFSWERPIEQAILEFCQGMASKMENAAANGQREVREGAGNYAKAYRTVEKQVLREIEIRKKQ